MTTTASPFTFLPSQPPTPSKGSGLAIASLCVGVVSLLLCWIPIVNNVVFFLGLIGLGLGVPAFLGARKGRRSGKGLATAGVLLSVLSMVGVLATQAFYTDVIEDIGESVSQDLADTEAGLGTASEAEAEAAVEAAPLALGQAAEMGAYTVTVTAINTKADDVIEATNEYNDPPKNQYVLVNATVTYNGDAESTPDVELSATFAGSDGRQYDATYVVTPLDDEGAVTLTKGGTSNVDFVMDVPAAAIPGGRVLVQETFNLGMDERAYWAVA